MVRTLTLDYILNVYQENIFDFDYDFDDTTIGNRLYNKEYIESCFKDYYLYYQIGYSTIEEFKFRLKRKWKSNILQFNQLLKAMPTNINLANYSENLSSERHATLEKEYSNKNDNRYSDTPNQDMGTQDEPNYLTDRTLDDFQGESNDVTAETNTINKETFENKSIMFDKLNKKIHNVMYEFFESMNGLFITDVFIENGIL